MGSDHVVGINVDADVYEISGFLAEVFGVILECGHPSVEIVSQGMLEKHLEAEFAADQDHGGGRGTENDGRGMTGAEGLRESRECRGKSF